MTAPQPVPWATAVETHTAALFFVGEKVFKVKKPVDLGFLDFSTPAARLAACRAEVRLNRRLEPDVYEGVADITVDGTVVEHAVVMRRLPADRSLAALVARADSAVGEELTRLASVLAEFHESCPVVGRELDDGRWIRPPDLWRTNVEQSRLQSPAVLAEEDLEAAAWLAQRYAAGRDPLFRERLASGLVRDGHGDLLTDDVFCLADGPRVLDCLEFDDRLRTVDVLLDAVSLAADLERLGRPDLAELFLAKYAAEAGESHPISLEHYYMAYRALVRAKVAAIRAHQGDASAADEARALLGICVQHLHAAQVRVVMIGGLPGAGKSTVSAAVAQRLPGVVIGTDVMRYDVLPGDGRSDPYRTGRYDCAVTDRIYAEMVWRAREAVEQGRHVVLDASWASPVHRKAVRAMAHAAHADLVEVCVAVDDATAEQRLADRRHGPGLSEADALVRTLMKADFAPWPEAAHIDTSGSVEQAADGVLVLSHNSHSSPAMVGGEEAWR